VTVEAITRAAQAEAERLLGAPVDPAEPVTDPVGDADPLDRLPDWLLDHVAFLRAPLSALRGDPAEINANAAKLRAAATDMLAVAAEQANDDMATLGRAIDATATITVLTGTLVHRTRAVAFGMVAALVTDLARGALLAEATAQDTSGGSIAVFTGNARARAVATATLLHTRITALVAALARQAARLTELDELMNALNYERGPAGAGPLS
jgi:hypothetical protein